MKFFNENSYVTSVSLLIVLVASDHIYLQICGPCWLYLDKRFGREYNNGQMI